MLRTSSPYRLPKHGSVHTIPNIVSEHSNHEGAPTSMNVLRPRIFRQLVMLIMFVSSLCPPGCGTKWTSAVPTSRWSQHTQQPFQPEYAHLIKANLTLRWLLHKEKGRHPFLRSQTLFLCIGRSYFLMLITRPTVAYTPTSPAPQFIPKSQLNSPRCRSQLTD